MTDRSTDPKSGERDAVLSLLETASHYYLKYPTIQEKIVWKERTFYSKLRRIDRNPLADLESKILTNNSALYLPLCENGMGHFIALKYDGGEVGAFLQALEHLRRHLGIGSLYTFFTKSRLTVLIRVERTSIDKLHEEADELSRMLMTRFTKTWRVLPDPSLPDAYNVFRNSLPV